MVTVAVSQTGQLCPSRGQDQRSWRTPPKGAEGEVALAQAQLDAAIATRDEAVADAEPGDVERVRREQDLLVLAAQNHLTAAKAALDELSGPVAHWLHASVRRSPFVFVL